MIRSSKGSSSRLSSSPMTRMRSRLGFRLARERIDRIRRRRRPRRARSRAAVQGRRHAGDQHAPEAAADRRQPLQPFLDDPLGQERPWLAPQRPLAALQARRVVEQGFGHAPLWEGAGWRTRGHAWGARLAREFADGGRLAARFRPSAALSRVRRDHPGGGPVLRRRAGARSISWAEAASRCGEPLATAELDICLACENGRSKLAPHPRCGRLWRCPARHRDAPQIWPQDRAGPDHGRDDEAAARSISIPTP